MSSVNVLIVEDDEDLREALGETVDLAGYSSVLAESAEAALKLISKAKPSVVVTDVQMGGMNGHALLKKLGQHCPNVPVILITAHSNVKDAVSALQNGAVDYLAKPFEPQILIQKIQRCLPQDDEAVQPIAEDPQSKALLTMAERVSASDATVLISGESGTGKEVLARFIHDHSARSEQPFVAINCAAIPETMLEATLFGYEKGAFTGAYKATPGKFEQAQGGTLLLDEISEMDLALQAKILRVLQERELERIGSNKMIELDVRVIATTNRNLQEEVSENRFREDLYYRLNVFPLAWVPLRDRKDDILPMADYILTKHFIRFGKVKPEFTEQAKSALMSHPWPGNAREMDNVIQRALILQQGDAIEADDLNLTGRGPVKRSADTPNKSLNEFQVIVDSLDKLEGNRKEVANELGISERTLRYKLAKMREVGYSV